MSRTQRREHIDRFDDPAWDSTPTHEETGVRPGPRYERVDLPQFAQAPPQAWLFAHVLGTLLGLFYLVCTAIGLPFVRAGQIVADKWRSRRGKSSS
jgi:hypothetical protein